MGVATGCHSHIPASLNNSSIVHGWPATPAARPAAPQVTRRRSVGVPTYPDPGRAMPTAVTAETAPTVPQWAAAEGLPLDLVRKTLRRRPDILLPRIGP